MQKILAAAIAGILMGLTPDPFGLWFLAWVALIPLWLLTQQLKIKESLGLGAIWGFCYHGIALFWITGIHPMTWLGVPWLASLAIAMLVWLAITTWGLVLVSLWAGGMAWLTPKLPSWQRVIVGVALFCTLETLWSWSALYWTALGYTQSPHNLLMLQISKLSGQQTMTAAIVAVNGLLAEAIAPYLEKLSLPKIGWRLIPAVTLIAVIVIYGAWVMELEVRSPNNGEELKVGIIQGNIPNPVKLKFNGLKLATERYAAGYEQLAQKSVDVILTPETALPFLYPAADPRRQAFDQMVETYNMPVWMGGFGTVANPDNPYGYSNSLFLRDRTHTVLAQYNKVRLVPIGEFIPFKSVIGGLIKRLSPLKGDVEAGSNNQIVDSPWGKLIMAICYESAYPAHFRDQAAAGGQVIFTASNNAHYAETMPAQHHAQDVARAIETDRWAVRATNTGYSAIVDPNGRTIWRSQINSYEIHEDTVYLRQTTTPYVRWGDWLTPLLGLTSITIIFRSWLRP